MTMFLTFAATAFGLLGRTARTVTALLTVIDEPE